MCLSYATNIPCYIALGDDKKYQKNIRNIGLQGKFVDSIAVSVFVVILIDFAKHSISS